MPRKKKESLVHLDLEKVSQEVDSKKNTKVLSEEDTSLGGILKKAREKKKMSVAQISKKLCIKEIYLEALESGQYYVFPGLAYGVGFLRTYALFLGLDASEMIEKFNAQTSSIKVEPIEMPIQARANLMPSFKTIIKGLSLLLIVYLVWYIVVSLSRPDTEVTAEKEIAMLNEAGIQVSSEDMAVFAGDGQIQEEGTENTQENEINTTVSAGMNAEVQSAVSPVQSETEKEKIQQDDKTVVKEVKAQEAPIVADAVIPQQKPVQMKKSSFGGKLWSKLSPAKTYGAEKSDLSFVANEEVWIQVTKNGQPIFEEILYEDDRYNVPESGLMLNTANAGALTVYVKGRKKGPLGAKGAIAEGVNLSADSFN
ncbi:MAG: DUF4115 domain-containing protein [Alphaproteobacteria bacterium]|nr:DUF4115 domain-containing protein [Alphaproteobacteria bacterium]